MKYFTGFLAVCFAGLAFGENSWPLVSLRSNQSLDVPVQKIGPFMDTVGKFRGTFDEIWFCSGEKYSDFAVAKADAEKAQQNLVPLCKKAGIDFSVQQGITLGHGPVKSWPLPSARKVADDAWTVDKDGNRLVGIFCPRSPDALQFVYDTVKATVAVTHPKTYWLDDDLRLGISKPEVCFCERCIKAFNEKNGTSFSRDALVKELFDVSVNWNPIRTKWMDFNAESLAMYGASARKAIDDLGADTKLCYQAVWSDTVYTGRDFKPLLDAISSNGKNPTAIRPGAGWYHEGEGFSFGLVAKCLSVAREAERCRAYGPMVGSVSYENETYPRHFLNKSPSAQVAECALAMASGCDAVSVYCYCEEDFAYVDEFSRVYSYLAAARPYFERMRKEVLNTHLGGVARYIGSHAYERTDFDLRDESDVILAQMGVPVTCAEAGQGFFYVNKKSVAESDADEIAAVRKKGVLEFDLTDGFRWTPSARKREQILDRLDSLVPGGMPARLMESRHVRVLPRIDANGRTSSVTIMNLSMGETDAIELRVRRPSGKSVEWLAPQSFVFDFTTSVKDGEIIIKITNLPAGKIGTFFLK